MVIALVMTLDMAERKQIIKDTILVLSKFTYIKEIYLFGSMLDGKITAASNIDLLIIVDNIDPKKAYLEIAIALEDRLKEKAYIIDLHVISKQAINELLPRQLLKRAKRILKRNST